MKENNKPRPDVYQMVTDRIITALEKGIVPWKRPWRESGPPQNLVTKKIYRGINFWLLLSLGYTKNYFLSYQQVKDFGGKIKKNEKGNIIVFWKVVPIEDPETGDKKDFPFLRYYTVYNIEQCEGLPEGDIGEGAIADIPIPSCEDVVNGMPEKPVIRHKGDQAYYNPLRDFVNMPPTDVFKSSEAYYSVLFHELIHSTGHKKRLARKELLEMAEFGSEHYSIEELTAEIGSCFIKSICNLDADGIENNAAYIQGWLNKLKNDKRFIIYASTQAQKAADFILNLRPLQLEENVENTIVESDGLTN